MQNLTIGSHIKTSRKGYSHHGIYCGDGKVVHYSGFAEAFKKGALEVTTLKDFLGSETRCYTVKYPISRVGFSSREIVDRALSRVGENSYNIAFNNCEHFAVWCVTDKSESRQVNNVLSSTTAIIISFKTMNMGSAATKAIGLTTNSTKILTAGRLTGCTVGALSGVGLGTSSAMLGTAAVGTSSAVVGSSTVLGFSAALGGGAVTAAAAPVALPILAVVGAGAVIGGFLGGFFD